MDFKDYIVPIIAVAVYLVFLMIKNLIPEEYRKYIPLGAGTLGVLFMMWYKWGFDFVVFLEGLASGLSAVGIDNVISIAEKVDKEKVHDPKKEGVD